MSDEKRQILEMLSAGKVTVEEAEKLMQAVDTPASESAAQPHFFRIDRDSVRRLLA